MNLISRIDTHAFHWLFSKNAGPNCTVFRIISKTGDGQVYLILGLVLWMFESRDGALFLYTGFLAYAMELPLYVMLKQLIQRARPCDAQQHNAPMFTAYVQPSDKFSLPSGHTAAAFLMANLLAHFYPSFAILVFIWAGLIGLSRVMLGVHYPGDIVAGMLLGLTISSATLNILF